VHLLNFQPHGLRVADHASCPLQHALAFWRESQETGRTLDQRYVQHVFELLDALRECRLRHAATLGRTPKMLFASQRD
jgi:hypothetical protein